jgi:hypothetical protein
MIQIDLALGSVVSLCVDGIMARTKTLL